MAEYKPRKEAVDNYHKNVKPSELDKLGAWIQSWPSTWYKNMTGKEMPQQPERPSLAPQIYKTLTGKEYPEDPNPVIKERKTAKTEKPAAPAPPAKSSTGPKEVGGDYTVAGVTYDGKTHRPKGAPEGGYSLQPDGKMTPHPAAPTGPTPTTERTNANGLKSYGRDLASLNIFTKAFTGGYEVADIDTAFKSNDLPTSGQQGANTDYSVDDAVAMGMPQEDALTLQSGGERETVISPNGSTTTTLTPASPQEGSSDKPDVAESIRTVRMKRQSGRGSRRDPRNRGEDPDMFGGPEPSDESLVSPMYKNSKRNAIRSAFLDTNLSSVQASVKANAIAGYGKDSDGNARFNVGGELVNAKEGMQQQAKNAAMMGLDPREFLDIKVKEVKDAQKDSDETK